MNKMYLVLGDWSDDGHGKTDKVLYEVNKTVEEVQEAYKQSCKLTSFRFDNETYVGVDRSRKIEDSHQIAVGYDNYKLSEEAYEMFKSKEFDFSDWGVEDTEDIYIEENFEELWWFFIKLSLPDLEYVNLKVEDTTPVINGYWDDNLNVQFAYGMYN